MDVVSTSPFHKNKITLTHSLAQPSGLHDNRTIAIPPLRAPESFLGGEWDKPADIWAFGCLVGLHIGVQPLF